jgi:histidine decarboxylase
MNKIIQKCIENAGYAIKKFSEFQIEAWRNKNSIIVVFPRPSIKAIRKWQLAIEGDIAHLITLPHVTKKMIDQFVNYIALDLLKNKKLKKPRALQKK